MRSVWTQDDLVILLAWLDFCKDRPIHFDNTIENHLAKNASQPFTKAQINNKFGGIVRGKKPNDSFTIHEVGSSYFPDISEEIRRKVRLTVTRYGGPPGVEYSTGVGSSSSNRPRPNPPKHTKRRRIEFESDDSEVRTLLFQ